MTSSSATESTPAASDADQAQPAADGLRAVPRKGRQIRWYRTPIDASLLREFSRRSDFRGALQTSGFLGIYATTGALSVYSAAHWRWYATTALVFLHGMVAAFMINGVHELGHNTVF